MCFLAYFAKFTTKKEITLAYNIIKCFYFDNNDIKSSFPFTYVYGTKPNNMGWKFDGKNLTHGPFKQTSILSVKVIEQLKYTFTLTGKHSPQNTYT